MARLEYEITGTNTGLANAASGAIGILQNLQKTADNLKIQFFGAQSESELNSIGGALQIVTGRINDYTAAAIKGSQAFKDQSAQATLDALAVKLSVLAGNSQLFGDSIQNQEAQIRAYQSAIDKILSQGFDPLDSKVQSLKGNIDQLTSSIAAQKEASKTIADPFLKFAATGSLIKDAENRVRNLGDALKNATDTRSIAQYNLKLVDAQKNLAQLRSIGLQTAASQTSLAQSAQAVSRQFNGVGLEFGRIIQDAPFAANNFGAIGNNITRLTELLPGFKIQLQEVNEAQKNAGQSVTPFKNALGLLTGGFAGLSLAISLAVTAFTFYQQYQQKVTRDAENHASALQTQKKALDDYIISLNTSQRASAGAVDSYAKEVVKLDVLYASLLKNSDARYGNVTALQELQKSWPEEFGNLQKGEALTDKVTQAYDRLRSSLIQTAVAQAAQSLSEDETKSLVKNTVALQGATEKAQKDYADLIALQKQRAALITAESKGQQTDAKGLDIGVAIANTTVLYNELYKQVQADIAQQKVYQKATQESSKTIESFNAAVVDAQNKISTPVKSGIVYNLEQEIKRLQDAQPLIKDKIALEANVAEVKKKQAELDALLGRNAKDHNSTLERQLTLQQQLQNILAKGKKSAEESGLEGYALEVQKINDFYKSLNDELDKFNAKVNVKAATGKISKNSANSLLGISDAGRSTFNADKAKELADAQIKEAQRVAGEIERINDEFGVKAAITREKEIAQILARYDTEVRAAKGNKDILAALDNGRLAAIQTINDKYLAIESDLQDKIQQIDATSQAVITGKEEDQTERIKKEWEDRRKAANKYYDALIQLQASSPLTAANGSPFGINIGGILANNTAGKQRDTNTDIDAAESKAVTDFLNKDFYNALKSTTHGFLSDLSQGLFNASKEAGSNFQSVFASITSSFATTIQNGALSVIQSSLEKKLQAGIDKGLKNLGPTLQGIIGGLAIAGGLISGLTPKTSKIGQGLGGALSGAASGALIGSVLPGVGTLLGGAIGGVVGLVGGIFSASKAQKELQAQQLEQAKQQTDLLKQQVAYTSSVIGRMTNQGVVTGVSIGAFGQLTATVSGKDLQFILDRNSNGR